MEQTMARVVLIYVARTPLKGQSVGVGHVSDTGTAGTRLPACPLGVQQKNNIILFRTRSRHFPDTVATQQRQKEEEEEEEEEGTLQAGCIRATETLRSPFLSLMCCCLLSSYCMCLPFSFFPSAFQSRRSSCCFSPFSISLLFFFFFFL
jgi:hypothetical protein